MILSTNYAQFSKFMWCNIYNCLKNKLCQQLYMSLFIFVGTKSQQFEKWQLNFWKLKMLWLSKGFSDFQKLKWYGILVDVSFWYCLWITSVFQRKKSCDIPDKWMTIIIITCWDRRGRDRMVVGYTTTYAISAYHHWCCEFESRSGRGVQHYVIKFVSDLRWVDGILRFPPAIKLTATI